MIPSYISSFICYKDNIYYTQIYVHKINSLLYLFYDKLLHCGPVIRQWFVFWQLNAQRPRQNAHHFTDDILRFIFSYFVE